MESISGFIFELRLVEHNVIGYSQLVCDVCKKAEEIK